MQLRLMLSLFVVILSAACGNEVAPVARTATAETAVQVAPAPATAIESSPAVEAAHQHPVVAPAEKISAEPVPTAHVAPAKTPSAAVETKSAIDLASTIIDPSRFTNPDIRDTYEKAKLVADRLDKMYCYCMCRENPGLKHRSLLTCFQSDHAAECGICLNEGKQAYLDYQDGMPLEVTTKAVDLMYNLGNPPPGGHPH